MDVNLSNGYTANIQIKDKEGCVLYQQPCSSEEELKAFIHSYGKSKNGWSFIQTAMIPLRTQNLKDFSKDFFLPTFVNFALKINNLALKIIASIFTIILDIATAPLRLLTTPFRIYYNRKRPESEHPLINLIKSNPQSQKALKTNFVDLCYESNNVRIVKDDTDLPENFYERASKITIKGTIKVALKVMTGERKKQFNEEEESAIYIRYDADGEWGRHYYEKTTHSDSRYAP